MADLETHRRLYRLEQALADIRAPDRDPRPYEEAQRRADAVATLHGVSAPPPILGESAIAYRRRLLSKFQGFSPTFGKANVNFVDAPTLALLEDRIYADAAQARHDATPGELRAVESRDAAGRLITRFHGDVGAFLAPFVSHGQRVKINRP
jgi:hypothetical protein